MNAINKTTQNTTTTNSEFLEQNNALDQKMKRIVFLFTLIILSVLKSFLFFIS